MAFVKYFNKLSITKSIFIVLPFSFITSSIACVKLLVNKFLNSSLSQISNFSCSNGDGDGDET